jgi:hypothetical protein
MTNPGPAITLNVHQLAARPDVVLVEGAPGPLVAVTVSEYPAQVNLFVRARAECDGLIKAALAAKDLLPPDEPGGAA